MEPEITIVLPVWDDYVSHLPECVAALRAQDPQSIVLVVDNASRTPVPELPGTRVIRSERRVKLGESRNVALPHVQTELVMFVDADDRLTEGALRALYEPMAGDPALGFAAGRMIRLNDDGSLGEVQEWPPAYLHRLARWPRLLAMRSIFLSSLPALFTLFRTQLVRDAGGFGPLDMGEDWALANAVAFRARGIVLERPVRAYRFSDDSIYHRSRNYESLRDQHRAVRRLTLRDPAVPLYVKALMPLFALNHWQVIRRELRIASRAVSGG